MLEEENRLLLDKFQFLEEQAHATKRIGTLSSGPIVQEHTLTRQPSFKWATYVKPAKSPTKATLDAAVDSPRSSPQAMEHDVPVSLDLRIPIDTLFADLNARLAYPGYQWQQAQRGQESAERHPAHPCIRSQRLVSAGGSPVCGLTQPCATPTSCDRTGANCTGCRCTRTFDFRVQRKRFEKLQGVSRRPSLEGPPRST